MANIAAISPTMVRIVVIESLGNGQFAERDDMEYPTRSAVSFRLDAGLFDDRPPLFDLGFLQRSECLGRLLVPRWNVHPKFDQALTRRRIGKQIHNRGIEL